MIAWLVACSEPDGSGSGEAEASAATARTGDVEAACAATDNALRFDCAATFGAAGAATWTVSDAAGGVLRTFDTAAGTPSDVTLWGLPPDRALTWRVASDDAAAEGVLRTGSLPSELAALEVTVEGAASDTDAVLVPEVCGGTGYLLVLDSAGEVVWYEATGSAQPSGYRWTDRETALVADGSSLTELGADGATRWTASGFGYPLHHDVERGGDLVYALFAHQVDDRVLDGVYVLRDGDVVATWLLEDHVTPTGAGEADGFWQREFPGADDWSHANSLWSDGRDLLVSLRWQDAVLKLDGDPASDTFGAVDWVLTGTQDGDVPGDFAWTDGGGFDGQHHASLVDGGVTVFDNGPSAADSRAVRIALDEDASTAREVGSWSMGRHCEVQGGVSLVGDSVLVTCATASTVSEFGAGDDAPRFTLTASCGGSAGPGGATGWSRAMPVSLR